MRNCRAFESLPQRRQPQGTCLARVFTLQTWWASLPTIVTRVGITQAGCCWCAKWRSETCKRKFSLLNKCPIKNRTNYRHELKTSKESLTKAPKGCHSVKGCGETEPDPAETITLPDGVEVPLGKPKKITTKSDLLYNEWVFFCLKVLTY